MTKEELVKINTGLIYKISNYFYNVDKEDLFNAGVVGLCKAYDNYKDNKSTKFSSYAYDYIYGEMYSLVNKSRQIKVSRDILKLYKSIEKSRYYLAQKLGKIPNNYELSLFLEKDIKDIEEALLSAEAIMSFDKDSADERSKYETIALEENVSIDERIDVLSGLETLSDSEREIIKSRYFKDMTQSEVAKKLNMTQVMVSRYEKKGLDKMRVYMTV